MVLIGIIAHFALGQKIPAVLSEFIDGLANSFGGAALFYLGLTMVTSCFVSLLIMANSNLPLKYYVSWIFLIFLCCRLANLES